MGMQVLQAKFFDGDLPLDVTNAQTAYFGGQPVRITPTGVSVSVGDLNYIGVAKNSRFEDALNGKATVVRGFKGQLLNGSDQIDTTVNSQTVEGLPYDSSQSYAEGDLLYINATSGLWTKVQSSGSPTTAKAKGIVTRAPSGSDDSMEAYFFDGE
jgi:hypothetical protein